MAALRAMLQTSRTRPTLRRSRGANGRSPQDHRHGEKSAVVAEAAPRINHGVVDVDRARDAVAFELAYGGLGDEAFAFYRRVIVAVYRRKGVRRTSLCRHVWRRHPFGTAGNAKISRSS